MEVPGTLMVLTQTPSSIVKRIGMTSIYNAGAGTHSGIEDAGPKITTQLSGPINGNGNASFSVTASGHPVLTFQWYKMPGSTCRRWAFYWD